MQITCRSPCSVQYLSTSKALTNMAQCLFVISQFGVYLCHKYYVHKLCFGQIWVPVFQIYEDMYM